MFLIMQDKLFWVHYIALDNPLAARGLVQCVFEHGAQLEAQPESGSHPPELRRSRRRYRQIVEPPCRVFYRYERSSERVFVLYVMRGERRLRKSRLIQRDRKSPMA